MLYNIDTMGLAILCWTTGMHGNVKFRLPVTSLTDKIVQDQFVDYLQLQQQSFEFVADHSLVFL